MHGSSRSIEFALALQKIQLLHSQLVVLVDSFNSQVQGLNLRQVVFLPLLPLPSMLPPHLLLNLLLDLANTHILLIARLPFDRMAALPLFS